MTPFTLRPYAPELREDYLRLLRSAWGDRAMGGAEFDWWFGRNPAGSLLSVAERNGQVVGVAGHTLARARLGGAERLVAFSVHATTDASARGLGIFQALERRHEQLGAERGVAAVLAFASAPTAPLFFGPLGWSEIDGRRIWARPLPRLLRRLGGRVPVREVERFGAQADAAYRLAAPGLRNHLVRDAEYLNWRYLDSPRRYRAFASADGFAVVGQKRHRGVRLAILSELVAPAAQARALLRRCVAEARRNAQAIVAVPGAGSGRAVLAAEGFLPAPTTLDFMGKGLAAPLDRRPDAWRVSLGDTDFF